MKISKNVKLSNITKWQVGGVAKYLSVVDSVSEYMDVLNFYKEQCVSPVLIGNTSNVLFDDGFLNIGLIKLGEGFRTLKIQGNIVDVGASMFGPAMVRNLVNSNLSGLEHLIGVPATLGGLIYMNGGSQRKTISENIVSVTSVNKQGELTKRLKEDCDFNYRESIFQANNEVIISAELILEEKNNNNIRKECLNILKERRKKFPKELPNCGSVFVSNPKMYEDIGPPGYVIEQLGLKGKKIGGAMISPKHANFIVNVGGATSKDIRQLIHFIKNDVYSKTGYELKTEIKFISGNS